MEPNQPNHDSSREPQPEWLRFDAYVFDIDGTLLNSRDLVHYRAFKSVLRDVYGCERDITEVPLHGNTDIGILRATTKLAGIDDEEFARELPRALAGMRDVVISTAAEFCAEVCPSIPAFLELLKERGKMLGVATGNLEEIGWPKLEAAGLRSFFQFGAFSDHHERRTDIFCTAVKTARARAGASASVCFVGDTPSDIEAAHENNCPIIAVATGIYPFERLQPLGPDFCLRSCDELFPR